MLLFKLGFLYYITVNPSEVQLEVISTRENEINEISSSVVHFCIQNKAQNLRTSKFENFSSWRSTQQFIQISNVILNYIQNCLIKKLDINQVFIGHWKSSLFYHGKGLLNFASWQITLNRCVYHIEQSFLFWSVYLRYILETTDVTIGHRR